MIIAYMASKFDPSRSLLVQEIQSKIYCGQAHSLQYMNIYI